MFNLAANKKGQTPRDIEAIRKELTLDRDGCLAFSPNDPDNPRSWSRTRRWCITSIALLMVLNCSFASSAPTGTLPGIQEAFHVSQVVSNLVTTLFLLGYCAGPLLWAPLSEQYGRQSIFYISFGGYFAFNFLCAWAPNLASLLIGRFLTGTFASSAFSNGPGVVADLWDPIDRGIAMSFLIMFTFLGPVVGPITSGFLQLTKNWRWTFYELLWFAAMTIVFLPFMPETLAARRLTMKARRVRCESGGRIDVYSPQEAKKETLGVILRRNLLRPFQILFDTIAFCVAAYISLVYAVLYMMFTIYPIIFQEKRGWNAGVGELPLIGLAVGAILAASLMIFMAIYMRKHGAEQREWKPESRLPLAMVGAVLFPVSMFWLAWSGNYTSVPWIVPTLAGGVLGMGIVLVFVSMIGYLTDSYLQFAASASAVNTVCRSAAAAGSPLFTNQMFRALGVGGAGSLLAGVACLLAPIPFLFYRFGPALRKRSKWAPVATVEGDHSQEPADSMRSEDAEIAAEKPADGSRSDDTASEGDKPTDSSTSGLVPTTA